MASIINELLLEGIPELENKRIHLSKEEIHKIDTPIWNKHVTSKPGGGLFYAMGDTWVNYLAGTPKELYSRKYIYEIVLKPSARILAPKTKQDYIDIAFKYPAIPYSSEEVDPASINQKTIEQITPDYKKIFKEYDGIEIFAVNGKSPDAIAYDGDWPIYWPGDFSPPHGAIWNNDAATLIPIQLGSHHFDAAVKKGESARLKYEKDMAEFQKNNWKDQYK